MIKATLAPGARIECRSAEWLVRSIGLSSNGQQVVDVVGVSPFLQEKEAKFLVDVEKAYYQTECTWNKYGPHYQYCEMMLKKDRLRWLDKTLG